MNIKLRILFKSGVERIAAIEASSDVVDLEKAKKQLFDQIDKLSFLTFVDAETGKYIYVNFDDISFVEEF